MRFQLALTMAQALERCGLRCVVGGSPAGSLSGELRSTLDVDLVVSMTDTDVDALRSAARACAWRRRR